MPVPDSPGRPRLRTLGDLSLAAAGARPLPVRREVLALLAWLARRSPHASTPAELAALLWPGTDPSRSLLSLREALSELRPVVGRALESGDRVSLAPGALELDLVDFEAAISSGRADLAAELCRGEFLRGLDDLGGEEWRAWIANERGAIARLAADLPSRAAARLTPVPRAPPSPPPATSRLQSPEFVGRDRILARLQDAWSRAAAGGSAVVVVEGEEGLGKTRLAREFARLVRRSAAPALVFEAGAAGPARGRDWGTLEAMIHQVAEAPGLPRARPRSLAALASLHPALRERFPGLPDPPTEGRMDLAFARIIGDLAAETPILLLVDDAPLADAGTLQALSRLARRTPPGLMLLLTGRTWSLAESPLAPDLRRPTVTTIPLAILDRGQVAALAVSMAPLAAEALADLAPALHAASGGRPGQAAAMLARLVAAGGLAAGPGGQWRLARPLDSAALLPPDSAREAAIGQLRSLDPSERVLVEAAATEAGSDPTALERAAAIPAEEFRLARGRLLLRRIFRESEGGRLEFTSDATRRAMRDLISPGRRRALLRRLDRRAHQRGGAAAVMALLLVVAGAFAIRHFSAPAIAAPPPRLLVAAFENHSGDPALDWLGRAAAEWLRRGVSISEVVDVTPPWRDSLPRGRGARPGARARAEAAARRFGATLVISGSYYRSGDSVHLRAALSDPAGGRLLQVVGPEGAPLADAMAAVEALRRDAVEVLVR